MLEVNPAAKQSESVYAAPVVRAEHIESPLTRMVEEQTAKIPSHVFLVLSLTAMAVSMGAELAQKRRLSQFVGMWPGPLLVMGVYNKLVKQQGPR